MKKALLAPACALALGAFLSVPGDATPTPTPGAQAATVEVVNHDDDAIRVYAVVGNVSHRLGTVQAGGTRTLVIPQALVQAGVDLQLMALPADHGTNSTFTDVIEVEAGDRLQFEVSEAMRSSRVSRTS